MLKPHGALETERPRRIDKDTRPSRIFPRLGGIVTEIGVYVEEVVDERGNLVLMVLRRNTHVRQCI